MFIWIWGVSLQFSASIRVSMSMQFNRVSIDRFNSHSDRFDVSTFRLRLKSIIRNPYYENRKSNRFVFYGCPRGYPGEPQRAHVDEQESQVHDPCRYTRFLLCVHFSVLTVGADRRERAKRFEGKRKHSRRFRAFKTALRRKRY